MNAQIRLAALAQICYPDVKAKVIGEHYDHQQADDYQQILEFAASFSLHPAALMAMTRRISIYTDACHLGIRYMDPASTMLAVERAEKPRSSTASGSLNRNILSGFFGPARLKRAVERSDREIVPNPLSLITEEVVRGDTRMAFPTAQRLFLGADRFQQSYEQGVKFLLQAVEANSEGEALAMLAVAAKLGLGGLPKNPQLATRLALLASVLVGDAKHILANELLEASDSPQCQDEIADILADQAAMLIQESVEKEKGAAAAMNGVAIDLIKDTPVKVKHLMLLSEMIGRGDPVATHMLSKIVSNNVLGAKSCSQSWSLMARSVRRHLWYEASIHALQTSKKIDDMTLAILAMAGVEDAEHALAADEKAGDELDYIRLKAAAFSAHRGRANSQLLLAEQRAQSRSFETWRSIDSASNDAVDETDAVLDAWQVRPLHERPRRFRSEEIATSKILTQLTVEKLQ